MGDAAARDWLSLSLGDPGAARRRSFQVAHTGAVTGISFEALGTKANTPVRALGVTGLRPATGAAGCMYSRLSYTRA